VLAASQASGSFFQAMAAAVAASATQPNTPMAQPKMLPVIKPSTVRCRSSQGSACAVSHSRATSADSTRR